MQESNIDTETKISRVNLLSKVYIWSVVMEPLYYFFLASQGITGIGGTFSRILQFFVITCLGLKLLVSGRVRISNPFNPLNINYTYYFIFAVLAGCYGIVSGAYSLDIGNALIVENNSYIESINSRYFRPFLEYVITFYYFVYFVVLARYLITTEKAINYFFRLFVIALSICFFVGFLDLLFQLFFKYEGFSSVLYRYRNVGFRFHGLAGEPRDAFSYLMLGLGILALRNIWEDKKKLGLFWVIFIVIAAILTQSFSGLIGIAFFCFMLFIYYLPKVSLKVKLVTILFVLLSALIVYINVIMSTRLTRYYVEFFSLYSQLDAEAKVDSIYKVTLNNVYPIWHLWLKIKEFEFLPFIIGNGFGSVSTVNNYYLGTSGVLINPNAFIIKAIYETGVIGTLLFIAAFLGPLKKIYIDHKIKNKVRLFMLLMLGMYFAHKSAIPYIFLGIALVVIKNKLIISDSTS